ncbi:MAG: ribbon-helix-helix domain-containing protein, partial [Sulfolobales archaeon]|nr:ribbon-helix-helix domain-containing protein [Sulfolobales archaeon]MDW8010199.1 ribbon-helix-helix domain-containing protein [Sulfolobales archaeon]
MDESLLSTLDSIAKSTGLSRSEIIRRALIKYLEDNGLEIGKI